MKKEDIIYGDSEYEIYKKHAGDLGTFIPGDCFEIIGIMIAQLKEWHNGGLKDVEDYEKIIERICSDLKETISR